jgi:anaerobic magnesium-protoporphyrin IX monomethyl ester cyclase
MKTRVLLVYPPSRTQMHETCPCSLTMLGAVLENAGHEVRLLDANAIANIYDSERIIRLASETKPDVIGMTLVTPIVYEAYRLAAGLRATGAKLLAGGPHATLLPEEPVQQGFDAAVVGEGEPTIDEAVRGLMGQIPRDSISGWVYRDDDGRIRQTPIRPPIADLDSLPLPARHLVNPADYGGSGNLALHGNLFSSRGCTARCSYCAGGLFGKRFRFRSAKSMLDEMAELHARYRTPHFHFMDDSMSANRARVLEICQGLEERRLGVTWSMMTRVDFVDEELLKAAGRSGCTRIDFGVESGHPETLKRIRKPHTVEMVRRIVPLTAAAGIKPIVFFILGFPWDSVETITETENLMRELAPYVGTFHTALASVLIPFPGTQIYDDHKDQYGFSEWWLKPERSYDAPQLGRHAHFETQLFKRGAALDANFFQYSPEVRRKIYEVFRFMWQHNLRDAPRMEQLRAKILFESSWQLHSLSPLLERGVFGAYTGLRRLVGSLRGMPN